jgi:hypothetical protein
MELKRYAEIRSLEQMVANTCFCKLRERCENKNSSACMRHRNIVAEFMAKKYNKLDK